VHDWVASLNKYESELSAYISVQSRTEDVFSTFIHLCGHDVVLRQGVTLNESLLSSTY
jgi:hypothetical protein